ncbi:hypothetical protein AAAV93_04660 [[Ruminococcus] lactaris]
MIKYIMILFLGGGKKPKDSLAIAEKNSIVEWRKRYEKENVEDRVVRIDSMQYVV